MLAIQSFEIGLNPHNQFFHIRKALSTNQSMIKRIVRILIGQCIQGKSFFLLGFHFFK